MIASADRMVQFPLTSLQNISKAFDASISVGRPFHNCEAALRQLIPEPVQLQRDVLASNMSAFKIFNGKLVLLLAYSSTSPLDLNCVGIYLNSTLTLQVPTGCMYVEPSVCLPACRYCCR